MIPLGSRPHTIGFLAGGGGGIWRWRSRRPLRPPLSPCSSPAGTPSLGCVPPPCGFPYWPRDCRQQYIHGTSMNMAVISDIKRKSKENCFVQVYLVHPQIHKYTNTFLFRFEGVVAWLVHTTLIPIIPNCSLINHNTVTQSYKQE